MRPALLGLALFGVLACAGPDGEERANAASSGGTDLGPADQQPPPVEAVGPPAPERGKPPPPSGPYDGPPKVLVVVTADAFRADYIERFGPLFGDGGFRRLLDGGAVFTDARVVHTASTAVPGYVAISTGRLPGRAAIPTDQWFDRETRKHVEAVQDRQSAAVGSDEDILVGFESPRNLGAVTLGEHVQSLLGEESLTFTFGWDARTALVLAGSHVDGAFWLDRETGTWVTSSFMRSRLPRWLVQLNDEGALDLYKGAVWERSFDDAVGEAYASPDDDPDEVPLPGGGAVFPYRIPEWKNIRKAVRKAADASPYGDMAILDGVRACLEAEPLGRGRTPDVLFVAFEASGYVGRQFGPDSQELMDLVLRLDERLAELMDLLDEQIGADRWTLAFTSPRGIAPLPAKHDGVVLDTLDVTVPVEIGLREHYPDHVVRSVRDGWLLGMAAPWLYVAHDVAEEAGVDVDDVAAVAAELAEQVDGIADAVTRRELVNARDEPYRTWGRDLHDDRSGDVLLLVEPWAVLVGGVGTASGSPHDYDRHVPLVLYGNGVRPGVYDEPVSTLDVTPSLAFLVGIAPPRDGDGRILRDALVQRRRGKARDEAGTEAGAEAGAPADHADADANADANADG